MKKKFLIGCFALWSVFILNAQISNSSSGKPWALSADANFYFFKDDFIFLPVIRADKNALHLEARYNYEDYNTFSAWGGYNVNGGKSVTYAFTPILGAVIGNSNGLAPGLEFSLVHKKFELYSESEYLFDVITKENNFFYIWSDLTYAPKEWLWFGLSAQRTRLYKTELDIQRGCMIGGSIKNWEVTAYLYNLFFAEPFALLSLTYNH